MNILRQAYNINLTQDETETLSELCYLQELQ
jgi:hypothetical protein